MKLRKSSLTTSPTTDEGDDGFLDLVENEDSSLDIPKGMEGLFSAPVLTATDSENTPTQKKVASQLNFSAHEDQENTRPKVCSNI